MSGYTLSQIVNEFLIEQGQGQSNSFARYYQFGLSFLRRTNFNTSGVPKVVELTISSADTADLPNDYVRYTRIALCCNGRLYCLGLDETLCLNQNYNSCGDSVEHSEVTTTWPALGAGTMGWPFPADNFVNGEFVGRMFGIGADNNCFGYYRIDNDRRQILFRDLQQESSVIMEYLADVSAVDDDFIVHPFMVEALKDWIQWKYKQRSSKPIGEQQMARDDFNNSNRLMRMMFNSSTKEEWVATFATGNLGTPKL